MRSQPATVEDMKVEYENVTPLYDQVRRLLLSDIKAGRHRGSAYLPPEADLCAHYNVSRPTVRRAVSELCSEGYLKRVRGKGTLITEPRLKQTLVSLTGFTESLASLGHEVRYSILESTVLSGPSDLNNRLQGKEDDHVVGVRRLLIVDDRPLTIEYLYFLQSRHGLALEPVANGGSFYEALRTLYREQPAGAERTINVDFPSAPECELLACTASQPVYRIEKLVLGKNQYPISFSVLVTPSDRVTYSITV